MGSLEEPRLQHGAAVGAGKDRRPRLARRPLLQPAQLTPIPALLFLALVGWHALPLAHPAAAHTTAAASTLVSPCAA